MYWKILIFRLEGIFVLNILYKLNLIYSTKTEIYHLGHGLYKSLIWILIKKFPKINSEQTAKSHSMMR